MNVSRAISFLRFSFGSCWRAVLAMTSPAWRSMKTSHLSWRRGAELLWAWE
ncbi:hypothetical protein GBAR_LOCUS28707 [Geodia barretti]|uniref:Uncharacterized protein n=1 Tax=Geodia barretti TaxID=519541 RepID=A0AA35XIW6_GEOBA|nr:hypothetical protein GBAR_LOCUS28707 [Geodia barretti]